MHAPLPSDVDIAPPPYYPKVLVFRDNRTPPYGLDFYRRMLKHTLEIDTTPYFRAMSGPVLVPGESGAQRTHCAYAENMCCESLCIPDDIYGGIEVYRRAMDYLTADRHPDPQFHNAGLALVPRLIVMNDAVIKGFDVRNNPAQAYLDFVAFITDFNPPDGVAFRLKPASPQFTPS